MTMVLVLSSFDNFLQLLGMTLLFIVVLAITYFTTKFVGGVKMDRDRKSNFKVIESYKITPNKFLQLVEVGGKYIVIAISKDSIQYITELDASKVKEMELPKLDIKFSEVFNKVTKNQKGKDDQNDH